MARAVQLEADYYLVENHFSDVCKRRARRFHFDLGEMAYLVEQRGVGNRPVCLLEITELGLGFCSSRPLAKGTRLVLNLTKTTASGPVRMEAIVVHATQQPNGDWRIRCEFVKELTPELLYEVISSP
jgi:hypothetical protein